MLITVQELSTPRFFLGNTNMARPSVIDYKDVEKAVTELKLHGKPINPYQVRKILGEGSEAKIAYYLKGMNLEIEYQEDDPLAKKLALLLRPGVIELQEEMQELIETKTSELSSSLEEERSKAEKLQNELRQSTSKIEEQVSSIQANQESLHNLSKALSDLKQKYKDAQAKSRSLQTENVSLQTSLEEGRTHLAAAKQEHQDVITLLREEHAETLSTQRAATEQARQAIHTLKEDLQRERKINTELAEKINRLGNTISGLNECVTNHQVEAREMTIRIQTQTASLEEKDAELKGLHEAYASASNQADERLEKSEGNLVTLTTKNEKLATEVELLKSLLREFKAPQETKTHNTDAG